MQDDLFRKFDEWFKTGQKRGLLVAVCTGQGAPERHAGWEWTELKVDGDANVKDLYRILAKTAVALKGTSQ